jgi:vacuolar-type H+-ATPase subunit H
MLEKAQKDAASVTETATTEAEKIRQDAREKAKAEYASELERQKSLAQQERERILSEAKVEAERITSSADQRVAEEVNKLLAAARNELAKAAPSTTAENRVREAVSAEKNRLAAAGIAELESFKADHQPQDFSRDSAPYKEHVRAFFTFRNNSNKSIAGIQFEAEFLDSFGTSLYRAQLQLEQRIPAGSTSRADSYWYWEDNDFVADQPYDKMHSAAGAETLKVKTKIKKVSFADGTVVDLQK